MKKIRNVIFGILLVVILIPFKVHAFSVSEKINSYDPVSKTLNIDAVIQVTKSGSYQLELLYTRPIDAGVQQKKIIYSQPILGAGNADKFSYTIDQVSPGDEINFSYLDVSGIKTENRKIIIENKLNPDTKKPEGDPIPTGPTSDKPDVDFYFTPSVSSVIISPDTVRFYGHVRVYKPGISVKIDVLLGDSPNSLQYGDSIYFKDIPESEGFYSWDIGFSNLKPGATYYYVFRNAYNPNPTNNIISPVYYFQTYNITGQGGVSDSKKPLGGNSPAATDNDGQGGIFSYQYPKNTGDPGSLNYDLSGADGQLVPCSSDTFDTRCRYADLMVLVTRIIKFGLAIILPIIAIIAVYTGIQMIMNRSNPIELQKYKGNATRIAIGIAVILLAWTLVATILAAVLGADAKKFILLDLTGL